MLVQRNNSTTLQLKGANGKFHGKVRHFTKADGKRRQLFQLLFLDMGTKATPPAEVICLSHTDQQKFIKIAEGAKRTYIDAYLHVKSTFSYQKLKRKLLQHLQEQRIMYIDEYTMQSLDEVQVGWLFGKSSFAVSAEGTKKWLETLLGQTLADALDFQVRSQGMKISQYGIETKTFAYVISASRETSQDTYQAMTKILPIQSDYTVGFVGYQAQNFAATQDIEGVNHYYIKQKWLTTTLRTKLMADFQDIDSSLILQGETTTFRQFMMRAVDSTGNCLMCDADCTSTGVPIILYQPMKNWL